MKRVLTILAAMMMIIGAVIPGTAGAAANTPEEYGFRILNDAFACEPLSFAFYDDLFICVFESEGVFFRTEAEIPPDVHEKLDTLDIFDADYQEKVKEAAKDLPVTRVYDLSEVLLSQADLNAFMGMTGEELLEMGFVPSGSYSFGEDVSTAYLVKGPFEYEFDFVENVPSQEDPDIAETIRPLTVKSASFAWVSDYCTEYDFDPYGGPAAGLPEEPETQAYSIPEIPVEESGFTVLADAFAFRGENYSSSMTDDTYVLVFNRDGTFYRVEADITAEIAEKANALDFFDKDHDQKLDALLGDLPVRRVADLSAGIPSQEELDMLIGMTGTDLLQMGFSLGSGYSFDGSAEMYLVLDLYEYHFIFNETVPEQEDHDALLAEIMDSLTVKKAEFFQLSDLCADPFLVY